MHVFVTMGDLKNLACDAWLLTTDHRPGIKKKWTDAIPGLAEAVHPDRAAPFYRDHELAFALPRWPLDQPLPVLTAVPMYGIDRPEQVVPAIQQFITAGANAVKDRQRRSAALGMQAKPAERPVPLLALPLFGTGGGGAGPIRGMIMAALLKTLRETAAKERVDVVLVLDDPKDFALAQQLRKREAETWGDVLGAHLQSHARSLAKRARIGQLVPFMGAGISMSAGAPSWAGLIERLASRAGFNQQELVDLKDRNVLDQASILRAVFDGSKVSLNQAIADEVALERYGLAPALLASLPSKQAITLNYDKLYENASRDAGMRTAVIPQEPSIDRDRWLLKLHGSVSDPDSIVLTREDYLGFNNTRSALSALVKANLITHHLLFVGFGLSDDHFHEIVHDVRRAFPELSAGRNDVATALTLSRDTLDEYAWKDKLTLLPMSDGGTTSEAGRTLEIFLDMVLAYAIDSHSYLLAPGYREVLTAEEDAIRTKLLELGSNLSPAERASSGGTRVLKMLEELGASAAQIPRISTARHGRPHE